MKRLADMISSFLYLGHSPFMPGTMGSLAGFGVFFLVKDNAILHCFLILFLFLLGVLFSGEAEKIYGRKDAKMIVIDEACGMLLSLFCVPYSILSSVSGFFIFRIMDILKPFPAKRIERMAGSMGIMFDDIVAALYTNLLLQIIFRYILALS